MKINYKEVCVFTTCPFCGRANEVEVNHMDYLIGRMANLRRTLSLTFLLTSAKCLLAVVARGVGSKMFWGDEE